MGKQQPKEETPTGDEILDEATKEWLDNIPIKS